MTEDKTTEKFKKSTAAEQAVIKSALRFDDSKLQNAFAEGYEHGHEDGEKSSIAALRRELEAEITRLRKCWADDYAVLDAVSRELTAEKARFEEHHAAWLENHQYLAGMVRELEVDAARYRWLRDHAAIRHDLEAFVALGQLDYGTALQFDLAIDAARAADAGERT